MSIKVMSYVWEHCRQKGSKKLMMLAIADHADDYGVAFPGVPRLATKCEMTERNAQSILSTLESEGEIAIDFKNGISTSHGNTNRYYLIQYRRSIGITGEEIITPRGEADFTPRDEEIITPGVIEPSPKPSVEPSVEPSKASNDAHETPVPSKTVRTRRRTTPKTTVKRTDVIFDAIAECAYGIKDTSNVNGNGSSIGAIKRIAIKQFELEYGKAEPDIIAKAVRLFSGKAHKSQWFKTTFEAPFVAYLQNNRKAIEALFNPPSEPEPKPRQTMGMDELTGGAS